MSTNHRTIPATLEGLINAMPPVSIQTKQDYARAQQWLDRLALLPRPTRNLSFGWDVFQ